MNSPTTALRTLASLAGLAAAIFATSAARANATLTFIVPPGSGMTVNALSADGAAIAGRYNTSTDTFGYRWTANEGLVTLSPDGPGYLWPTALNSDGSVVVGTIRNGAAATRAFRMELGSPAQDLGTFPGAADFGATAVNSYGTLVFGSAYDGLILHPFAWSPFPGIIEFATPPGRSSVIPSGVSSDGIAVCMTASSTYSEVDSRAYLWQAGGIGYQNLGLLPGFQTSSRANGMSSDGGVVVGSCFDYSTTRTHAFRWTRDYGMLDLGSFPGQPSSDNCLATAASASGSVIIGNCFDDAAGQWTAFIWKQGVGMKRLADVLAAEGVDMTDIQLADAVAVSADGSTITGSGYTGDNYQVWVAKIPPYCPGDLNLDHAVNTLDLAIILTHFGQSVQPGAGGDIDANSVVNTRDLAAMLSVFGQPCP